jgi:hypothetical protein
MCAYFATLQIWALQIWANWVLVLCIIKELSIEVVHSLCEFGIEHIFFRFLLKCFLGFYLNIKRASLTLFC